MEFTVLVFLNSGTFCESNNSLPKKWKFISQSGYSLMDLLYFDTLYYCTQAPVGGMGYCSLSFLGT
uniref:Uncharacterized protein n=1 Tax=Rhizophora mucronata TaxID=61149 RepID=A0A2P2NHT0_RHIMU